MDNDGDEFAVLSTADDEKVEVKSTASEFTANIKDYGG